MGGWESSGGGCVAAKKGEDVPTPVWLKTCCLGERERLSRGERTLRLRDWEGGGVFSGQGELQEGDGNDIKPVEGMRYYEGGGETEKGYEEAVRRGGEMDD